MRDTRRIGRSAATPSAGPSGPTPRLDHGDRRILELLERVECPLCPPSIAVNVRTTPTDARVRCRKLHSLGLLDRRTTRRTAYALTATAEDFLAGNVGAADLRWR